MTVAIGHAETYSPQGLVVATRNVVGEMDTGRVASVSADQAAVRGVIGELFGRKEISGTLDVTVLRSHRLQPWKWDTALDRADADYAYTVVSEPHRQSQAVSRASGLNEVRATGSRILAEFAIRPNDWKDDPETALGLAFVGWLLEEHAAAGRGIKRGIGREFERAVVGDAGVLGGLLSVDLTLPDIKRVKEAAAKLRPYRVTRTPGQLARR